MTIAEYINKIRADGRPMEQIQAFLDKVEEFKGHNAIIELNPDLAAEAAALDLAADLPLLAVPIVVKDNVNTAGRMHTTAGSLALAGNIAPKDAPLVESLRRAGALIIGKANLTEFSNFMSTMPNGYSSRGGQTRSVHNGYMDTYGSSSGSAVAVALGMCLGAIGTETCGSIITPAIKAGIYGIKPTAGLISGEGVVPISFTCDTAGPMAANADNLAVLMAVLAETSYDIKPIEGLRIGVTRMGADMPWHGDQIDRQISPLSPSYIKGQELVLNKLKSRGAVIKELDNPKIDSGAIFSLIRHEFKYSMNEYLKSCNNPNIPQTLADIIAFNNQNAAAALKFGQSILIEAQDKTSGELNESVYRECMEKRAAAISSLLSFFEAQEIDAIFSINMDISLAAFTGLPSMTIPTAQEGELPVGSLFIAKPYGEDVLLSIAKGLEG